jgi:hypothetical protein
MERVQIMIELTILALLFSKHFLIDFPLQTHYQYTNKGKYGHLGGLLHSGLHGLGTLIIFSFFTPLAYLFALADFLIHYHIDWAKVNINNHYGWKPTTHNQFWILLGADQYLHAMTYIIMVILL